MVGWLGGHLVFGVIDEVERCEVKPPGRKPITRSPSPLKVPPVSTRRPRTTKVTRTPDKDDQKKLDQFFQLIRSPAQPGVTATPSGEAVSASSKLKNAGDSGPCESETAAAIQSTYSGSRPQPAEPPTWGYLLSDTKTR